MLAAELNYTDTYIDEYMNLDKFYAYLEYRKLHPPAGFILKQVIEAFLCSNTAEEKSFNMEPETSNRETNQNKAGWTKEKLNQFIQDFSAAGGVLQ
jgi:hypothetical protein